MSSVNYDLKNRGVRLVASQDAWIVTKSGKRILNPKYQFLGKIEVTMPNMIVSASDKNKPKYRGDTSSLNSVAKSQIVDHFYDDDGKRNRRSVAYFAVAKKDKNNKSINKEKK